MGALIQNLWRSLRPWDYVALLAALGVIAAFSAVAAEQYGGRRMLQIEAPAGRFMYDFGEHIESFDLGSEVGCELRLTGSQAWVERSDCPFQVCVQMGRIERPGQWIACIPHGVFVKVVGTAEGDTVDAQTW